MDFEDSGDHRFQLIGCTVFILDQLWPDHRQTIIGGLDRGLPYGLFGQELDELLPLLSQGRKHGVLSLRLVVPFDRFGIHFSQNSCEGFCVRPGDPEGDDRLGIP